MFVTIFNMCSDFGRPVIGSQMHCAFSKSGLTLDSFLGSTMIDVYCHFGMILDTCSCFGFINNKNDVCFDILILGFASGSDDKSTIGLFYEMSKGLLPGAATLNCVFGRMRIIFFWRELK